MRASKVDDEQVWQLIKERMDECGITLIDVADQDLYLAQLIKRGIAGEPVTISDSRLYDCAKLIGLISHRGSGQIPSRDGLITLFKFGELSHLRQNRPVDWGCG